MIGADATFGVGVKQTAGCFTQELALIVYVRKKKPPTEVGQQALIPARCQRFATDVVEDRATLIADHLPYDPLIGGIEISRPGDGVVDPGSGTLGAIVRERLNGALRLLTCGHVAATVGQPFYQPTHGREGATVIGTVLHSVFSPQTPPDRDWAVIEPDGTRELAFMVKEVGALRGAGQVQLWDPIKKRGRTTGLTTGLVVAVIPEFPSLATLQIECATFPFGNVFARPGDSGSVVLNERDEVVALLYRLNREITDEHGNHVETTGMAYAIDAVLNDLQMDVALAPTVTSVVPNTLAGTALTFGRVVIDGWGFDPSSQIAFGDSPVVWSTWVSASRMETTPPLGHFGTVDVRVSNKWGEWSSPGSDAKFLY